MFAILIQYSAVACIMIVNNSYSEEADMPHRFYAVAATILLLAACGHSTGATPLYAYPPGTYL